MYVKKTIAERVQMQVIIPSAGQSSSNASVGQLVDMRLDVFKHAQQNHVVDAGPDEDDGEALIHAGFGHGHRGLANLL